MTRHESFLRALAPAGNLFLLLTLPEMRRQGITYLAFYALQRTVDESGYSEYQLRRETGLQDYEASRACAFLAKRGMVSIGKAQKDRRVRVLVPTDRGRRVVDKILSLAARELKNGIPAPGRFRRLAEATTSLRQANRILRGPLQLSFFDRDLFHRDSPKRAPQKRATAQTVGGCSKSSKP